METTKINARLTKASTLKNVESRAFEQEEIRLCKLCYFTRSASIHIAILANHYIVTHLKSCVSVQLFTNNVLTKLRFRIPLTQIQLC